MIKMYNCRRCGQEITEFQQNYYGRLCPVCVRQKKIFKPFLIIAAAILAYLLFITMVLYSTRYLPDDTLSLPTFGS